MDIQQEEDISASKSIPGPVTEKKNGIPLRRHPGIIKKNQGKLLRLKFTAPNNNK